MESFLQQCVEERNLKYVRVCCFFLCCRSFENDEHFSSPKMVERDESNSYICVYMCRKGEGIMDWSHAAPALSLLLYNGEVHELQSLLVKFEEESKFLSLGSVAVLFNLDEIRGTIQLLTPESLEVRYEKRMEGSDLDCLTGHAPLLRLTLNELSDEWLAEANTCHTAEERIAQLVNGEKVPWKYCCQSCAVGGNHLELISEIPLFEEFNSNLTRVQSPKIKAKQSNRSRRSWKSSC